MAGCARVTEAALLALVHRCIALHTLNLDACDLVTARGVAQMADGLLYAQVRARSLSACWAPIGCTHCSSTLLRV